MSDPLGHDNGTGFLEDAPVESAPRANSLAPISRKEAQAQSFLLQQQREQNELIQVLQTDAGQAVLLRILDQAGIYANEILSDAAQGRRTLGMWIIHQINEIPGAYPALLVAHAKRKQRQHETDAAQASNAKLA